MNAKLQNGEGAVHSDPGRGARCGVEIAFGILGQTTMHPHGQSTVNWGSAKLREMLAVLLLHRKRRVSLDKLSRWIWADEEQQPLDLASTARTYTTRISKAIRDAGLPGKIQTTGGALCFDVEADVVDYFAFTKLINEARAHDRHGDHQATCELINSALALWHDEPLADLTSQPAEAFRYSVTHNEWLPANQLLLGAQIALGHYTDAQRLLDELQREHSTDLGLAKRRLDLLHTTDRPHDETDNYQTTRKLLQDSGMEDAAAELRRYHYSLITKPSTRASLTSYGAGGAAKRLATLHTNHKATGGPQSLLPQLPPPGRTQLPPAIPEFVGHDDLQATLDNLARTAAGQLRPGVIVLDGLAGIGKTTLAVHWAHRQLGDLVDNAFYVDLHGFDGGNHKEAAEAIDELLDGFDIPIERFATTARREAKLREVLAGKRTLILLDNVRDSPHVRPLLLALSPCLILVTSRTRLTGLAGRHGARHCTVTPLNPRNALTVLTDRIGTRAAADPEAVARLAALCGGLPLGLQLVGAYIEVCQDATLAQFAEELRDHGSLLDIGDGGDDPHANLRAALMVTYDALSPEARLVFRLLGLSPILEVTLHVAAALAGCSLKESKRALDALVGSHFLAHAGALNRYHLHDLLRAFARELASNEAYADEHGCAEIRLLSYYFQTSYGADRKLFSSRIGVPLLPPEPGVPELDFATDEDATTWLLREMGNLTAIIPWAAKKQLHDYAWRLPHNLFRLYRARGRYAELLMSFKVAVASTQVVVDLESEAASRNDLGLIYIALDDWQQASAQFHLAAAIAQQINSPAGIPLSLAQLGFHEAHAGNIDKAAELYTRALTLAMKGSDPSTISSILHRFADIHRIRRHYNTAIEFYHRALDLRMEINELRGQAETLVEIADTLTKQEKYPAAVRYGQQALHIIQYIGDIDVGSHACSVLAIIHHTQGDHRIAVAYARQATRLAKLGHNATTEAEALHTLGHALHELGHLEAAREGWSNSAAIYSDIGNKDRLLHIEGDLEIVASLLDSPPETSNS
jgi:tetratricopeptide (TPR) repeat protein/DNA-binding SARP family transcriptional activator